MAANTTPIFPLTPFNWQVKLTTQIAVRDVTTQVPVLLGTAGKNGSLIHTVYAAPLGNNVASILRLYLSQNAGYALLAELTLPAITTAGESNAIDRVVVTLPAMLPSGNTGLHLAPDAGLYAALGTAIAAGVQVCALGGNF